MAEQLTEDRLERRREALIKVIRAKTNSYEIDTAFYPASSIDDVHTTAELIHYAENDKSVDIEGRILCLTEDGVKHKRLDKKQFIEAFKNNDKNPARLKESFDSFGQGDSSVGGPLVGEDFIPLLGGPFNKQLYMQDYLRQHTAAFHAANHDPFGKRIINTIRQFVLGKGYRIDVVGGKDEELGIGVIRALEKQNDLKQLMHYICTELSEYGEVMIWRLPNHQSKIEWQLRAGQESPKALLPRYRLIDPSTVWEIVGYPEDINRPLFFQVVAPTQFQLYTAPDVPSLKFIVQQIPADQVFHYKVNVVSNEKRGRSDLFPLLGYFKRMRDLANYRVIREQKNAAWSIDTTVEGNDQDIQDYIDSMEQLSTIAPAGSDFVHTSKVKREYLGNQVGASGDLTSFEILMNMIAAGSGIPVSYFGVTGVSGQSRATALVGTEPVAKMMEERQQLLESILRRIVDDTLDSIGLDVEFEITFPEIITQDRSAKIKDVIIAETKGYLSKERSASITAKELGITDYEFDAEQARIKEEKAEGLEEPNLIISPLTMGMSPSSQPSDDKTNKPSAVTSQDKRAVSINRG